MKPSIIAGLLLWTISIFGQGSPKLDIQIADSKVNISEAEKKSKQINYAPGDTILYTIHSKNVGDGVMKAAVITDPIPAGVSYIAESVTGDDANIVFSIDGGNTYENWPVYYSVRNSKGVILKRKATGEMVTHIQWQVQRDLEAGESHQGSFKVVVNP